MLVFLHIGWHRTGSSSLQTFLHEQRTALAARFGIGYPDEGLLVSAHHPIAWAFLGRTESAWGRVRGVENGAEACVRSAIAHARDAGLRSVVFSSEEFRTFDPDTIGRLAAALHGHADEVRVVAYLRRQDAFVESAFNMEVQWWGTRERGTFREYVARQAVPTAYAQTLDAWANVFGREALVARVYRRDADHAWDVRADFGEIAGVPRGALPTSTAGGNGSLGPTSLEALRVLNNLDVDEDVHRSIVARLHEYDAGHHAPRTVLFEPGRRRAWLAAAERDTEKLDAFGVDPAALALGDTTIPERNVLPLSPGTFAQVFSYLAGRG